jgi:Tfp pilus assembly protein PilF
MLGARPRLIPLVLISFVPLLSAFGQNADYERREAAWSKYELPQVEFTRQVDNEKVILFRVPSSWQQDGYLQFKGPNEAELRVVVEKIPDGLGLRSYTNALLQNLRDLPGGADSLTVRRTEISSFEAREFLFNLPDPRGRMTRRTIWSTVSGPHAFSFVFIVPEAAAEELEPYFKAVVESAVVFESGDEYDVFERLRSAAIKEAKPVRIDGVRALVRIIDGYDHAARGKAIAALASIFDSTPDAAVELLMDRHRLVRASAIEAVGRSSNRGLDGFLVRALADESAAVAVRAARSLATRNDIVKLLREDSANWEGLQSQRLMRAMPFMNDRARHELIDELLRYKVEAKKQPPPPLPPKPSIHSSIPSKGSASAERPTEGSAKRKSLGVVNVYGASRSYDDNQQIVLELLPDLESVMHGQPLGKLLEDEWAAEVPLRLAIESRTRLPVDRLLGLLASTDRELTQLAAINLAVSATAADIGRIEEAARKATATPSDKRVAKPPLPLEKAAGKTPPPLEKAAGKAPRPLAEELRATIKKIRWRERLEAAGEASREALFIEAFADDDLAAWAWPYVRDAAEGPGPKHERSLLGKIAGDEKKTTQAVSPLAENLLPKNVDLYAAMPDSQALIDKLTESLSSIQLGSARDQAKLLLMFKGFENLFQRMFGVRAGTGLLESSGVKPHSPVVFARWTADKALRGLSAARRKAVIFRVQDRDRFENLVATYHELARFEMMPEYVSVGARLLTALPAILPLVASAISSGAVTRPAATVRSTHTLIGYESCEGYPVTVFERREILLDDDGINRDTVYLAYVNDVAILASDWFSLRDCLSRLEGKGETLAGNSSFKQAAERGGDVIYLSDPLVLMGAAVRKAQRPQLTERGALKITRSGWESSFDLSFGATGWQKLFSFKPSSLKAPSVLLPQSSIAYLLMSFDVAAGWRMFASDFLGAETTNQFKSIWSSDFDLEVLTELGPESGVVLLGMPSLKDGGFNAPWAAFVQTKSDKLMKAFAEGKLIKGAPAGVKAARVRIGSSDHWITVKNGFLIIANSEAAIERFDSAEHLSAAREYERAFKNAAAEVVAFGGCNIEAATSSVVVPKDSETGQGVDIFLSLARAFHSLNLYAAPADNGLNARLSVSLDREGRYSLSDLAALSKDFQFAAAEVEARGVPLADQRRIDSLKVKITSKARGALERIKQDVSSAAQIVEEKPNGDLVLTIRPRRAAPAGKIELPISAADLAPFVKRAAGEVEDQTVASQAREIAGADHDAWGVARKLADWTFKNLKWKRVDGASAGSTLATREADCLEFSQLYVAMSRALGLPARIVSGLAHSGSSFGGHAWVEVWVGEWVELDPTWGTNYVDATHIKSSELLAYAALNLVGIEVLESRRSVPDFQKDPVKLVDALSADPNTETRENVLGVVVEPEVLIDGVMGKGAWAGMSSAERDQVYSELRRLVLELRLVFTDQSGPGGPRVLRVTQDGERAEALFMTRWQGGMMRLKLIRKGEAWFVQELRYEDEAYNVLSEALRPTLVVLRAKRDGTKPPSVLDSAETRVSQARRSDQAIALQVAEESLKENPGSPTLLYLKALCLLATSKKDGDASKKEGVRVLGELSDRQPAYGPAVRSLADYYAAVGDQDPEIEAKRDKAIELFRRYAALVPEDPRPREKLAAIYEARHDSARAEVEYRAVIERDPQLPGNYSDLARFLVSQRRYQDALTAIDQSRGRGESKDEMFAQLFLSASADKQAAEFLDGLAAAAPNRMAKNSMANLYLGWLRINDGRAGEAIPLLKTAASLNPKIASPHVSIAEAYRKLHNWASALKSADAAIQLETENTDAHFQRACALAQLRRPTEAIASLKKAIELDEELMVADDLEAEPDLKPLAGLPAFKKLVQQIKQAETDSQKKADK